MGKAGVAQLLTLRVAAENLIHIPNYHGLRMVN